MAFLRSSRHRKLQASIVERSEHREWADYVARAERHGPTASRTWAFGPATLIPAPISQVFIEVTWVFPGWPELFSRALEGEIRDEGDKARAKSTQPAHVDAAVLAVLTRSVFEHFRDESDIA